MHTKILFSELLPVTPSFIRSIQFPDASKSKGETQVSKVSKLRVKGNNQVVYENKERLARSLKSASRMVYRNIRRDMRRKKEMTNCREGTPILSSNSSCLDLSFGDISTQFSPNVENSKRRKLFIFENQLINKFGSKHQNSHNEPQLQQVVSNMEQDNSIMSLVKPCFLASRLNHHIRASSLKKLKGPSRLLKSYPIRESSLRRTAKLF